MKKKLAAFVLHLLPVIVHTPNDNPMPLNRAGPGNRPALWPLLLLVLGMGMMAPVWAKGSLSGISDPCAGPSSLLALLDRPTVGDSTCVVKPGDAVLETGWARYALSGQSGHAFGYPQGELRFGLPDQNEFVFLPPNLSRQVTPMPGGGSQTLTGGSASVMGIKHEFGYNARWIWAGETLFTLPSGSPTYGSAATGYAVNGIIGYSLTSSVALTLMLGVTHLAQAADVQGGAYYWSVNPDLVLTWETTQNFQFYLEAYGQNHTGPGQGAGYDADGGVQYLLTPRFEVDAEIGQRLSGNLGGWSHYFGVGAGFLF